MNAVSAEPLYLSFAEAARLSGLSVSTLRRMAEEKRLRIYRPSPGRVLLSRRELIGVIEGNADAAAPDSAT